MKASLLSLDASQYQNHALHRGERAWLETNCYVDLWIEVLHAYGYDPHASLGFTVAADFEGDQWLFFKQSPAELQELYGVDVQELNIWRPLIEHVQMQLTRGRLVMVEVDAFYLPDTQGVSYRSVHTKTTIGIESIDVEEQKLSYFHNAGYYTLSGEDFQMLFGLAGEKRDDALVPYTEFARIFRGEGLSGDALTQRAVSFLKKHIARAPTENPIKLFRARFLEDVKWLSEQPQSTFHVYAFSTLRQCGACYELASSHMRWLSERGVAGLEEAGSAFDAISGQAKTLQFKSARAVVLKRPVDFAPMFDTMESAWDTALGALRTWAR